MAEKKTKYAKEHTLATAFKAYAALNVFAGLLLSIFLGESVYIEGIGIMFFAVVLLASAAIFAVGEIIQILHDIRRYTYFSAKKAKEAAEKDEKQPVEKEAALPVL